MFKMLLQASIWLLGTVVFSNASGQGINLADWTVLSDVNAKTTLTDTVFQGKSCVKLDGKNIAAIWNKKAVLKNFRLELDLAGAETMGTVMAGIGFHVSDERNYQLLYYRTAYGGTNEAIQYIPIYNGALSWVFSGAWQASADLQTMRWFHVAIEVQGRNLKVFTNNSAKPDLNITLRQSEADRGSILLRSMFGTAYFANLRYRELPEGITDWEISDQLPAGVAYGHEQVKKMKHWRKINETSDDYVNLCRYFKHPEGTLFARHAIRADSIENKMLHFDFTGTLRILLNGKELFHYDKNKLERVEADTYRIRLPLQKGNNELVLITQGDGFIFGKGYNSLGRLQHQNWGFIAGLTNLQ